MHDSWLMILLDRTFVVFTSFFTDAERRADGTLRLHEFLECLLLCAFQRANATLLELNEKTAHRVISRLILNGERVTIHDE